jgi:DNA replication and repair protein RecF
VFLNNIKFLNFKNHTQKAFAFSKKVNVFFGKNGKGKTNILDAIFYLTSSKSLLNFTDIQLIKHDESFFRIEGSIHKNDQNNEIIIKYKPQSKSIELNEVKYKKNTDFFGNFPIVYALPQDIFLLVGGSEERRKLMDYTLSMIDTVYLEKLMIYNKYLEQRNALLKKEVQDQSLFDFYNQQLEVNGYYIFEKRKTLFETLIPKIENWYAILSDKQEEIAIHYKSQLIEATFSQLFKHSFEKDKILKRTTSGIHKDDLLFEISDLDLKKAGSQGQQKSLLYALRLAQAEWIASHTSQKIVFIIDDFSDKLDEKRHQKLQEIINEVPFISQWFLTDTDKNHFEFIEDIALFEIA